MSPIYPQPIAVRRSTLAGELAYERARRAARGVLVLLLAIYGVGVTVQLIRARHELRIARGEILR